MPKDLPDAIVKILEQHRSQCRAVADQISQDYGSIASYCRSLKLETITDRKDSILHEFYHLFEDVFTLEDEREPIEGFQEVLRFNSDMNAQAEFGPFLEPIFVLREPKTKELVAAANAAFYAYPERGKGYKFDASCQLNFILVREDLRGLGLANELLRILERDLTAFANRYCGQSRTFITCEQNNPARMNEEQIIVDARAALIDPYDRTLWWRRRGFSRLDFPYVQPPLSAEQETCDYLDYYVRIGGGATPEETSLPAAVLLEHLRRFFFVSVGKFATDMTVNPQWLAVQELLSKRDGVAMLTES
jgi:hypothetical protein